MGNAVGYGALAGKRATLSTTRILLLARARGRRRGTLGSIDGPEPSKNNARKQSELLRHSR